MITLTRVALSCAALTCCAGSTSGGGSCENIAGTWTYTAHCDTSYVGKKSTITQDGCNIAANDPVANITITGTVSGSSVSGSAAGLTCNGSVSGNTLSLVCTGNCQVKLTR
jgi:hypothetical protein